MGDSFLQAVCGCPEISVLKSGELGQCLVPFFPVDLQISILPGKMHHQILLEDAGIPPSAVIAPTSESTGTAFEYRLDQPAVFYEPFNAIKIKFLEK